MAKTPTVTESAEVESLDVRRRDKTLSVYIDEETEIVFEILKDWMDARSKAEVARQAIRIGLRQLPAYDEAARRAREILASRAASR